MYTVTPLYCNKRWTKCACETLCQRWQWSQKQNFSAKVTVNVTRSSILVSFAKALLVEYAFQICCLYLLRFKFVEFQSAVSEEKSKMPQPIRGQGGDRVCDRPEKRKLGRVRWDLASYQVSLNSVQRFRGEVENVSAILFFRSARITQTC